MAWKVKSGDQVIVLSGKDKGRTGKITRVLRDKNRIFVEGIALQVRHVKPSVQHPEGGRISQEASIHVSNVALLDPETQKATRVGFKIGDDGKKVRFAKRSGREIEDSSK